LPERMKLHEWGMLPLLLPVSTPMPTVRSQSRLDG
jgi:hypothetical protein